MTPPLADGTFVLSLLGDSGACQDIKNPQAGTSVNVLLVATHDATGTWIGGAASTVGGDVQIRLTRSSTPATAPSGPPHPTDFFVAGTMSGTATDSYVFEPGEALSGTSALLGSGLSISGIIRIPSGTFGDGYNGAPLTFARNGVFSTCPSGAVGL